MGTLRECGGDICRAFELAGCRGRRRVVEGGWVGRVVVVGGTGSL